MRGGAGYTSSVILGLGVSPMRRRAFIALVGSGVAGWPIAARARQPAIPVIGFLNGQAAEASDNLKDAFLKCLSESGYTEGGNLRNPGQVFLRHALSNAWPPSKRA